MGRVASLGTSLQLLNGGLNKGRSLFLILFAALFLFIFKKLLHLLALVFSHDVADTIVGAAHARVVKKVLHVVAVVIHKLIAFLDALSGYDPDFAIGIDRFTIPIAGVIHVASGVVAEAPVDVIFVIELENVNEAFARFASFLLPCESTLLRFLLRDFFTRVLDDLSSLFDLSCGVESAPVDFRGFYFAK